MASAADERLIAAHRALREGGRVQFDLQRPDPPPQTPEWLKALAEWLRDTLGPVGRFFAWLTSFMPDAPYARIILWSAIAILALLVARMVYDRFHHGEWRLPHRRRRVLAAEAPAEDEEATWTPAAAPARRWLEEADRLAEAGHFGQAVHFLLLRSVEDIGKRRPRLLRPALTSRELACTGFIPSAPRSLFADLAAVVERSLFGGAPVGADEWARCRAAFADFSNTRNWHA